MKILCFSTELLCEIIVILRRKNILQKMQFPFDTWKMMHQKFHNFQFVTFWTLYSRLRKKTSLKILFKLWPRKIYCWYIADMLLIDCWYIAHILLTYFLYIAHILLIYFTNIASYIANWEVDTTIHGEITNLNMSGHV